MKMYTVETAARKIGIGESTLRRYITAGTLKVRRIGRRVLIDPGDLRAFVDGAEPLPLAEAAAVIGVAESRLHELARDGYLPAAAVFRTGRQLHFRRAALLEYAESQR